MEAVESAKGCGLALHGHAGSHQSDAFSSHPRSDEEAARNLLPQYTSGPRPVAGGRAHVPTRLRLTRRRVAYAFLLLGADIRPLRFAAVHLAGLARQRYVVLSTSRTSRPTLPVQARKGHGSNPVRPTDSRNCVRTPATLYPGPVPQEDRGRWSWSRLGSRRLASGSRCADTGPATHPTYTVFGRKP